MTNTIISRFWSEQDGAIVSAEIMLVATILVLGVIVGLKSVRDSVVTELADVAQAFANVDQSFCYSSVSGHAANSGGGDFNDQTDFCDLAHNSWHQGQRSKCVDVASSSYGESWSHR
jgi:hypothetical protein